MDRLGRPFPLHLVDRGSQRGGKSLRNSAGLTATTLRSLSIYGAGDLVQALEGAKMAAN